MADAPTKSLYFPTVNIQSIDWLKSALLFWEGIKRIIPYDGFATNDPPELEELVREGLIENVIAEPYAKEAAKSFCATPEKPKEEIINFARIHRSKLDSSIVLQLLDGGHALEKGEWILLNNYIAHDYMTVLANIMSKKLNAPTITDMFRNEVNRLKEEYGVYNPKTREDKPYGLKLAWILCSFPTPESLSATSLDDVLKFREGHRSERQNFRESLHDLGTAISAMKSREALNDLLRDRRHIIEDRLKQQQETIRALNIKTISQSLALSIPSTISSIAAGFPPLVSGAVGALSLGVSIINIHAGRREDRKKIREACPYHYLISIKKELNPDELQREYTKQASNFFIM